MMRRDGRRMSRSGSLSTPIASRVLRLFTPLQDSWFDASSCTTSGGKVTAFVDRMDPSHTLAQATSGLQVATPVADVLFAGAPVATFVAATGNKYDSNRAASAWRYWQDGTGMTAVVVYAPTTTATAFVVSTRAGITTENGGLLACLSPNTIRAVWSNGTALLIDSGNVGVTAVGTPTVVIMSYKESRTPKEFVLQTKATSVYSADTTNAPSTSDPQATLRLGCGTAGLLPVSMTWRALYTFRRVLSASEINTLLSFIHSDCGVRV